MRKMPPQINRDLSGDTLFRFRAQLIPVARIGNVDMILGRLDDGERKLCLAVEDILATDLKQITRAIRRFPQVPQVDITGFGGID